MLHIHNGDCSANTGKQSSVQGEHFAWREELIEGPTPAGLEGAEWRKVRAQHLSQSYGLDLKQCEQALLDQDKTLASFHEHDEVVLWFEYDLFCQLNLLYLLNWFSQRDLGRTRLSLICIDQFPDKQNFRGLGELNGEQLASLFPRRTEVSALQLKMAASAWEAYVSPDPTNIEKLLQTDSSFVPFLEPALRAHLRRFPSTKNGLGAIENTGLALIHGGSKNFIDVFPVFGEAEPVYGLGDAQFWNALRRMTAAKQPLLRSMNSEGSNGDVTNNSGLTLEKARTTRFELTEAGKSVLRGEADFVTLNGINLWLGGVHLQNQNNLWRWDEESETLKSTQTNGRADASG
ncbi:MAG: hypothetical protein M3R67_00825 [Acidobacteriota bacterium]|nr:hypothetical protein [Acidobacteriota bacterium]